MPVGSRKGHLEAVRSRHSRAGPGRGVTQQKCGWASLPPAPLHTLWLRPLHPPMPFPPSSFWSCIKTSSTWTLDMYVVHINIYNGYMLHMIHESMHMNYVYMDKVKLICRMNIDRMYMKLTFQYMTYLYKYFVPGSVTITATITMQCTNTIPRSHVKVKQRTSWNIL